MLNPWPLLKPLLVGLAVSAALAIVSFAAIQMAMAAIPPESFEAVGAEIYFAAALLMLFFPAFSAGYVAKRHGALYGLLLAAVPIALFSLVNAGVPVLFYFGWLAVAVVGGYAGQSLAQRTHADHG
ncbi:MAG TPA: hypothetical protein VF816_03665 [Rhodocyclaceae bacterium]